MVCIPRCYPLCHASYAIHVYHKALPPPLFPTRARNVANIESRRYYVALLAVNTVLQLVEDCAPSHTPRILQKSTGCHLPNARMCACRRNYSQNNGRSSRRHRRETCRCTEKFSPTLWRGQILGRREFRHLAHKTVFKETNISFLSRVYLHLFIYLFTSAKSFHFYKLRDEGKSHLTRSLSRLIWEIIPTDHVTFVFIQLCAIDLIHSYVGIQGKIVVVVHI